MSTYPAGRPSTSTTSTSATMWDHFDGPPLSPVDKGPVPVKRFERPFFSDRYTPSTDSLPLPSDRSTRTATSTAVRSFHRPFYNESHSLASASRTSSARSTTASPVESSPTTPISPSRRAASFSTARTSFNPSSCSADDASSDANWHGTHQPEQAMCVVPPSDWEARFYSDEELGLETSTDECPDLATLAAVQEIPLYDAAGQTRTFGSVYAPSAATHQRQLIIFVRHFYCAACQGYLRALSESIPLADYFAIPVPTSFIVIGCGRPSMIENYRRITQCPFPIYADPTRALFKKLGMAATINVGLERPEYLGEMSYPQLLGDQVVKISKSYADGDGGLKKLDILKGGNIFQVGGEFLFEGGQVVWCHRMRNWRNHAEVSVLRKLLELDF